MFERSEFAPAAKIRADEGSLAQPNLQPGSPFFCLLCFGEAKKSKWPRGQKAQSKTIRKHIKTQHILKIIRFVLLCLPMDCRIQFGNDGLTFQAALASGCVSSVRSSHPHRQAATAVHQLAFATVFGTAFIHCLCFRAGLIPCPFRSVATTPSRSNTSVSNMGCQDAIFLPTLFECGIDCPPF